MKQEERRARRSQRSNPEEPEGSPVTAIVRVRPVDGAASVAFGYDAAEAALGAIAAALTATCDHGGAWRRAAGDAVIGWRGAHREEFDRACGVLDGCTQAALDALAAARRAVLGAVDEANAQQVAYNVARQRAVVGAEGLTGL
jgi:hypothetical protein